MQGPFPVEAQRRAGLEILKALGYTEDEWRLDETPHPFASSPGLPPPCEAAIEA